MGVSPCATGTSNRQEARGNAKPTASIWWCPDVVVQLSHAALRLQAWRVSRFSDLSLDLCLAALAAFISRAGVLRVKRGVIIRAGGYLASHLVKVNGSDRMFRGVRHQLGILRLVESRS
jgi:hypothetical protein